MINLDTYSLKNIEKGEHETLGGEGPWLIITLVQRCKKTKENAEAMEALYQKYKEKGLQVIGVLSDHRKVEDEKALAFYRNKMQVTFPIYEHIAIHAPEGRHPLFVALDQSLPQPRSKKHLIPQFTKFLINKAQEPVARYTENVPEEDIEAAIENQPIPSIKAQEDLKQQKADQKKEAAKQRRAANKKTKPAQQQTKKKAPLKKKAGTTTKKNAKKPAAAAAGSKRKRAKPIEQEDKSMQDHRPVKHVKVPVAAV